MKGKYSDLSISEIRTKVENGTFTEDKNLKVIRDENKKFVRFLEEPTQKPEYTNYYSNQYFQIVNNYITYDVSEILNGILDINNQEVASNLKILHNSVLIFLKQYQSTRDQRIVQKLNENCLEAISNFQVRLSEYFKTEIKHLDKDLILVLGRSYLDLLKIYKFSNYWYQNKIFDYEQILELYNAIFNPFQKLFESLVCLHTGYNEEKKINYYAISKSLYMKFFLERKNHKIYRYSKLDSRFEGDGRVFDLLAWSFQKENIDSFKYNKFDENTEIFVEKLYVLLSDYQDFYSFNNALNSDDPESPFSDEAIKNKLLTMI